MSEISQATVTVANTGLNGGGVTSGQLSAAVADRAPSSAGFITKTAEAGLSNEFALSSMSTGLVKVTTGTGALTTAVGSDLPAHNHTGVVVAASFLIDGGGAAITTGVKGDILIPFAATITKWTLLADQSGSIVVDIWKQTYASYPATSGQVITASAKPTISTSTKGQSGTLTGWTTSVAAGDTLRFNVNSITAIQRVTLILEMTRSI
ncbi:MAG: hypothetical protein WBA46_00970 [Thermomicrobiales bacterium]